MRETFEVRKSSLFEEPRAETSQSTVQSHSDTSNGEMVEFARIIQSICPALAAMKYHQFDLRA